ncbi:MAG TPA: MMPL family transporter, partial [Candidatus Manganitrophaceae bacterium]
PLAVLITGLIHYEAFRTIQGLALPLVTALLAVIWGVGVMGASGIPMDAFNASTPILILAVAAGHAVQILKRYYEEYHRLHTGSSLTPKEANKAAVIESVTRIGTVMLTAGIVAALGFFSLLIFKLTVIRTFGMFTGIGIISALILEMTFIPALRSLLPPPKQRETRREREERFWDRITGTVADWVIGPYRRRILAGFALLSVLWTIGAFRLTVDNSNKSYFFKDLPFQQEDRMLNDRLGGTNTLYLLVEGEKEDTLKDPAILKAIEATQRYLEQQPYVGKTLSLADFVKKMNKAMHGDDPAYDVIPDDRNLISQYLLLYSMSGEPGDFDSYVDYGYQSANIWVFLKTDSSAYLQELIGKLNRFF